MDKDVFKEFISAMNGVLADNSKEDGRGQQKLLEDLFDLENKFKNLLISSPKGRLIYKEFVNFIVEEKGNILSARVYFRERQAVFSSKISKCFKNNNYWVLYKFSINYSFAKWVCSKYEGKNKEELLSIFDDIIKLRKVLCENNIPLAINRAKIFWSKSPNSSLDYMDFIQDANEGLMTAIDKFVPPYKAVFRSTAIGRMTLNMITDSSSTMLKLSPVEKRILYRANNARIKAKLTEPEDILNYVRESFKNVSLYRLRSIMSASSGVASLDQKTGDTELTLQDFVKSDAPSPESSFLSKELLSKVGFAINNIPIIEMKLIKMKFGVEVPSDGKINT